MAIGFIDEVRCFACKEKCNGFELHEISPGRWETFCNDCALTLELDAGK